VYYKFTRELIVDAIKKNDAEAAAHLHDSRQFAKWAAKDRKEKAPALTAEQSRDLRNYVLRERKDRENALFANDS